jgi:hypothetical protein
MASSFQTLSPIAVKIQIKVIELPQNTKTSPPKGIWRRNLQNDGGYERGAYA